MIHLEMFFKLKCQRGKVLESKTLMTLDVQTTENVTNVQKSRPLAGSLLPPANYHSYRANFLHQSEWQSYHATATS
jgi:hypothetical protein